MAPWSQSQINPDLTDAQQINSQSPGSHENPNPTHVPQRFLPIQPSCTQRKLNLRLGGKAEVQEEISYPPLQCGLCPGCTLFIPGALPSIPGLGKTWAPGTHQAPQAVWSHSQANSGVHTSSLDEDQKNFLICLSLSK